MLIETSGDMFSGKNTILVIPVNTIGIMGAGVAKTYKDKYPKRISIIFERC